MDSRSRGNDGCTESKGVASCAHAAKANSRSPYQYKKPDAYLRRMLETKAFASSVARFLMVAISLAPISCLPRSK